MSRSTRLVLLLAAAMLFAAGCSAGQFPPLLASEPQAPAFSRELAIRRATESSQRSSPEIGILDVRIDSIEAELTTLDRADPFHLQLSGAGAASDVPVWWVRVRGKFRWEGMPAPDATYPVYEAAERDFIYDARTGEEIANTIPASFLVATATPAPLLPDVATVFLDVYSGRADSPQWTLAAADSARLAARLDALPAAVPHKLFDGLGYRGLIVHLPVGEPGDVEVLRIYKGYVRFGQPYGDEAVATYRTDPGQQVERFLLATGQPHIDRELWDYLSVDLTTPAQ